MSTCAERLARGGWYEDSLRPDCRWPIGPKNTFSNASYLAGAAYCATDGTSAGWAMALSLALLGVGSAAYHSLKTIPALQWDHAGMYSTFAALVVHGIAPEHRLAPWIMAVGAGVVAWVFAFDLAKSTNLNAMMGLLLVFAALPPILNQGDVLAWVSLGVFALSYGAWVLDRAGGKIVGQWGHALWHLGTSAAITLLYVAQL